MENIATSKIVKLVLTSPSPDSHKGQNGKVLIVADSPLFHGAGRLALKAVLETITIFASKLNDMVYFCSTKENLNLIKENQETFIGILREEIDHYLKICDVVLVGPGLMREEVKEREDTIGEKDATYELTLKVLKSNKKKVLDAGSLQVIDTTLLKGRENLIITPHRFEMRKLFNLAEDDLKLSHGSSNEEITKVANKVKQIADEYKLTILLKGPIDIIASPLGWYCSKGGNSGMTKGGSGDVLAGVVTALYSRFDDPLICAAAASYIVKKTGEDLWKENYWMYNSTDLAKELVKTAVRIISNG